MIAPNADAPTLLLIDPPYYRLYKDSYSLTRYPLSLGYLASEARRRTNWNVVVYNADFRPTSEPYQVSHLIGAGFQRYRRLLTEADAPIWSEVAGVVQRYRPRVVGVSCKSQTFAAGCRVAGIVKRLFPDATVVVGGPHVSMVGGDVLDCPDIDIAVRGEGERTLVEVLEAIEAGRSVEGVAGVIRRADGQAVMNPPRDLIENLDELSFPHQAARHVLHEFALYPPEAFNHIFAIRGCPYNCYFCGSRNVWTRRVRGRSVTNVLAELEELYRLGLRSVHFDDDTFGVKLSYVRELCEGIMARCPGMAWSCELHVNLVTDELVSTMASAGCTSIQLGVESGNNEILRQIRKGFVIDKAIAAADTIRRHGVQVQAFFMVGFPQETEQTLADTVAAMKRIGGTMSYSIFTPYPGTEAFEDCKRRGLIGPDYDVALHNHQSPANCFCEHIAPERFRQIVSRIERMVDRNNFPSPLRRLVRGQLSVADILQKGYRKLSGKVGAR